MMAIRLRLLDIDKNEWVALCAAEHDAQEGDVYIDDGQHYALAEKFRIDYADFFAQENKHE
jgi:hypothetical protein